MSKLRRTIFALVAMILVLGLCLPFSLVVSATEEDDSGIVATDPSNPTTTVPIEPDTVVTRVGWIQELVAAFSMTVEEGDYPDNYYCDISEEDAFYRDIMIAVEFGVVDLDAGLPFCPDDPATREFAAHTLNFCLGFQLADDAQYTFQEYEAVTYPDDIQVAVNRGWFALADGAFLPEQAIVWAELEVMLADVQSILDANTGGSQENTAQFAEGVIEVPADAQVELIEQGVLSIKACPVEIEQGDYFVVYDDGFPVAFYATDVTNENGDLTICVTTDGTEEIILDFTYSGTIDADLEDFVAAEETTVYFGDYPVQAGPTTYGIHFDEDTKTLTANKTFNIKGDLDATVNCVIRDVRLDYQFDRKNEKYTVVFYGTTKSTFDIHGDVIEALTGEQSFLLGHVPILYGAAEIELYAECSLSGEISLVWEGDIGVGFSYSDGDFRIVKNFQKKCFSFSAHVDASVGLKQKISAHLWVVDANIWASAGAKASLKDVTYSDGTPTRCKDVEGYLYVKVGAEAKIFGLKKFSDTKDIWKKSNSPVRVHYHHEDGVLVEACTRSDEFSKYTTSPSSKYFNNSYGNVSSTYTNKNGETVRLYDYILDENNQVTITGYYGSAYTLSIPSTLDGYPVIGIGDSVFCSNGDIGVVKIPNGITKIGDYAFTDCVNLVSVSIPNSVTDIGFQAFSGCPFMTTAIPETVENIGAYAFAGCENLDSTLVLSTSGIVIGDGAFYGCGLETVYLPDSAQLGTNIFEENNIKLVITCDTGIVPDSFLYMNYYGIREVEVCEGITEIGDSAFVGYWQHRLEKVVLPSTVTTIGEYAFYNCAYLAEIVMPEGRPDVLFSIGSYAFNDCSSLKEIVIPQGTMTIADYAFEDCLSLESITMPNSITAIGYRAFCGCTSLNTMIPDTVTMIGAYAFAGCEKLDSTLVLSASGIVIGDGAFYGCGLETVYLPDSAQLGTNIFEENNIKLVITCDTGIVPDSFLYMNYYGIREVEVCEGITEIGDSAFVGYWQHRLEKVVLPSTVTTIGEYAFYNCAYLAEIVMPEGSEDILATIGSSAFEGCVSLKTIRIPLGVRVIEDATFAGCTALESVDIATTVVEVGNYAFCDCTSLQTMGLPKGVISIGHYAYQNCAALTQLVIPDGITQINDGTFYGCSGLTTIDIPAHITYIGNWAFENCTALETAYIPNNVGYGVYVFRGDAVTLYILHENDEIPAYYLAYDNSYGIVKLIISDEIVTIGDAAFRGMTQLEEIHLPTSITEIADSLLFGCDSLKTVNIHEKIMAIRSYAFVGCEALEEVVIPDSVTEFGVGIFRGCSAMKTVTLPETCKVITAEMFAGCSSLTSLELPDYVTEIQANAFAYCSALCEIQWSDKLTTIGDGAFRDCDALISVTIPETVTSIGNWLFSECDMLISVVLPDHITSLPDGMFYDCSAMTEYQLPAQITYIGEFVFENCDALISVELPMGLEVIGARAFHDCDALTELIMPDSIGYIGADMCYSCDALANIRLSEGLVAITEGAFMDCQSLVEVLVPRYVTTIENNAFSVCPAMRKVMLFAQVENINASAFSYPDRLVIYGIPGSYAETFAAENGFQFADGTTHATSVTLECSELTMNLGTSLRLQMLVQPYNYTDAVQWKSTNDSVVTVDENGIIYAVGTGTAIVKVTIGDVSASCKITVAKYVDSIVLDQEELSLDVQQTYQFTVTLTPEDADNKTLIWTSSNTNVAVVDENGVVTAISKGTAIITATAADGGGVSASCTVYVANNIYTVTDVNDFESPHDYPNNCTDSWLYTQEGAPGLAITFDERTMFEDGFDFLYIYNANGELVGTYTGAELSGKTIVVYGPTVTIQLNTDEASSAWGFKVVKVETHQHVYTEKMIAPTCIEQGYTVYTCEACGDSYVDDYVDLADHSYGEWIIDVESSCYYEGEKHRECQYCGASEWEVITMIDHNFGDWEISTEPTCYAEGTKYRSCQQCGYCEYESIPRVEHAYSEEIIAATCTEQGYTYYYCEFCGDWYEGDYVEPAGHSYGEWYTVTEPTCYSEGTKCRDCQYCSECEYETLSVIDHSYIAEAIAPTCTEQGHTYYCCTFCGDWYEDDYVEPTGHSYGEWYTVTEPTCYAEGTKCRDCQYCSECEYETLSVIDHSYMAEVIAPTCTEQGYTYYCCTFCGDWYEDDYVEPTGHSYGEWYTVTEPTCYSEGTKCRDCQNCNEYESEMIPVVDHSYTAEVTEPTCTEPGYTTYTCTGCGATYTGEFVDAIADAHKFSPWVVIKKATVEEEGVAERDCVCCGLREQAYTYRIVPASPVVNLTQEFKDTLWALDHYFELDADYMIMKVNEIFMSPFEYGDYLCVPAAEYETMLNKFFVADEDLISEIRSGERDELRYDEAEQVYIICEAPSGMGGSLCRREYVGYMQNGDTYDVFYGQIAYRYLRDVLPNGVDEWDYAESLGWPETIEYEGVVYEWQGAEGYYYTVVGIDPCGVKYTVEIKDNVVRILSCENYTELDLPDRFDDEVIYDIPGDSSVVIPENDCFEGGTTVTVEKVEEGEIFGKVADSMENRAEVYTVFEFTATKDGAPTQPNGKLTVSFAIPADYSTNVALYYMDENGKLTKLEIVIDVETHTVTVELEHFSTYILADEDTAPTVLLGDVNGDGRINVRDARAILRYIAGLIEEGELEVNAADFNGDGRINVRDARAILNYIAGMG